MGYFRGRVLAGERTTFEALNPCMHSELLNSTALQSRNGKNQRTDWPDFKKPDNKPSCWKTATEKAHSGISEARRPRILRKEHGHTDSLSAAVSQVLLGPLYVGETSNCQMYENHFSVVFCCFVMARKLSRSWVLRELLWGNSRAALFRGLYFPQIYAFNDLGRGTEETLYHSNGLFFISFKIRQNHTFFHQIHRFWNSTFSLPPQ